MSQKPHLSRICVRMAALINQHRKGFRFQRSSTGAPANAGNRSVLWQLRPRMTGPVGRCGWNLSGAGFASNVGVHLEGALGNQRDPRGRQHPSVGPNMGTPLWMVRSPLVQRRTTLVWAPPSDGGLVQVRPLPMSLAT